MPEKSLADELPSEASRLLGRMRQGDLEAAEELYRLLYADLRRIAARQLRREGRAVTLSPTALVNEAYLRAFAHGVPVIEDRHHFLALSSQVMRRLLVDRARKRKSLKRDGGPPETLRDLLLRDSHDPELILEVDLALQRLALFAPRAVQIVEMRYFAGMEVHEVAEVLATSERTVAREWSMARSWLFEELGGERRRV
jgi:RNA polymerase sigma-70 factor, ECF subfamily